MPKPAKLFSLVDVDSWSSEGTWQNEYGFTITQLSPRQYRIYTPEGYALNSVIYPTLEIAITTVETMLGDYKMTNRLRRPVYKTTPQKYEMTEEPLSVPGWFARSMPDGTYSIGYSGPKGDYEEIETDLWDRAAVEEWMRYNSFALDDILLEQEKWVESDYTAQFGHPPTADEWGGQLPPSQRSLRTRRPLRTLSGIPSRVAPPLGVIRNDANKARGVAALRALRAKYRKGVLGNDPEFGDESENFDVYDDAIGGLEEAQRFIKEAIMVLESVSNTDLPGTVSGQLRQYTIPSLQSWIESEYQIGSLSDLITQLGGTSDY